MHDQAGLGRIGDVNHDQAGIAPGAISRGAVDGGVVQAHPPGRLPSRRFAGRLVHAGQPVASHLPGIGRVGHVDGDEDIVREPIEQRRSVSPASAGVPDAMNAAAGHRHEADLARFAGLRYVVDGHSGGPVARHRAGAFGGADLLADRALIIGLLILEFGGGEHILGVDHQQQIVIRLQMNIPGVVRRGKVARRFWRARVAHVDDAEPLGKHMADIGKALVNHQLHAVGPAALIAVANQFHIAGMVGLRQIGRHGGVLNSTMQMCTDEWSDNLPLPISLRRRDGERVGVREKQATSRPRSSCRRPGSRSRDRRCSWDRHRDRCWRA